ncbi:hypothetical protein NKR23_g7983 [Pleurostoma richardsiae]|uniref:Uncharacterized protein n=1 Tax=Pleurostoma richardsiae TaxID=41990 RepID=A0AA38VD71_9PEZI|nr:hypothetical protein NKR23_g7983 [Pleurostoma richardsiae]
MARWKKDLRFWTFTTVSLSLVLVLVVSLAISLTYKVGLRQPIPAPALDAIVSLLAVFLFLFVMGFFVLFFTKPEPTGQQDPEGGHGPCRCQHRGTLPNGGGGPAEGESEEGGRLRGGGGPGGNGSGLHVGRKPPDDSRHLPAHPQRPSPRELAADHQSANRIPDPRAPPSRYQLYPSQQIATGGGGHWVPPNRPPHRPAGPGPTAPPAGEQELRYCGSPLHPPCLWPVVHALYSPPPPTLRWEDLRGNVAHLEYHAPPMDGGIWKPVKWGHPVLGKRVSFVDPGEWAAWSGQDVSSQDPGDFSPDHLSTPTPEEVFGPDYANGGPRRSYRPYHRQQIFKESHVPRHRSRRVQFHSDRVEALTEMFRDMMRSLEEPMSAGEKENSSARENRLSLTDGRDDRGEGLTTDRAGRTGTSSESENGVQPLDVSPDISASDSLPRLQRRANASPLRSYAARARDRGRRRGSEPGVAGQRRWNGL